MIHLMTNSVPDDHWNFRPSSDPPLLRGFRRYRNRSPLGGLSSYMLPPVTPDTHVATHRYCLLDEPDPKRVCVCVCENCEVFRSLNPETLKPLGEVGKKQTNPVLYDPVQCCFEAQPAGRHHMWVGASWLLGLRALHLKESHTHQRHQ